MENFLFKKSYQLKTFSSLPYESLWGANGIFTTVRLYGDQPDLILIDEHIKKFNSSIKSQLHLCLILKALYCKSLCNLHGSRKEFYPDKGSSRPFWVPRVLVAAGVKKKKKQL